MILFNNTKNKIISYNLRLADSFLERFLGLMPKKEIKGDECLLITHCPMIHTCFMSFPIDVFFLDKNMKVCAIERNICPWRFSKYYKGAFYVVEFANNFIKDNDLEYDDILSVKTSI